MKSSNTRGAAFPSAYSPSPPPIEMTPETIRSWVSQELGAIAAAIETLRRAAPQVATSAPERPHDGMLRLAKGGWNPTSNASYDPAVGVLVLYRGGAWAEV